MSDLPKVTRDARLLGPKRPCISAKVVVVCGATMTSLGVCANPPAMALTFEQPAVVTVGTMRTGKGQDQDVAPLVLAPYGAPAMFADHSSHASHASHASHYSSSSGGSVSPPATTTDQNSSSESSAPERSGGRPVTNKNWKDGGEYDLFGRINRETDEQRKLDLLQRWEKEYPSTNFWTERVTLYTTTFTALGRAKDAIASAKQLIAVNPMDFTGLYYVTLLTVQAADTSIAALDDGEKASQGLLVSLDDQFSTAKKPAQMSDAAWAKARADVEAVVHTTVGWVAMQREDNAKAEDEFTRSLQLNPASGQVSYWLGAVLLAEKNPAKEDRALYDFARAASYDGPGSLSPMFRQQARLFFEDVYTTYHGSKEGLDTVLAATRSSALPPSDFRVAGMNRQMGNGRDLVTKSVTVDNASAIFTSTPSLSDIEIDGKYVGSTQSVLKLAPGTHQVMITKAGYVTWKRTIEVAAGSELTIHADLQASKPHTTKKPPEGQR